MDENTGEPLPGPRWKLKEFVPLRLRTLIDGVVERESLGASRGTGGLSWSKLKHGVHTGGGCWADSGISGRSEGTLVSGDSMLTAGLGKKSASTC